LILGKKDDNNDVRKNNQGYEDFVCDASEGWDITQSGMERKEIGTIIAAITTTTATTVR